MKTKPPKYELLARGTAVGVYRPGRPEPKGRRMTNREIEKNERVIRKQIAGRHDRWSDEARVCFWWSDEPRMVPLYVIVTEMT